MTHISLRNISGAKADIETLIIFGVLIILLASIVYMVRGRKKGQVSGKFIVSQPYYMEDSGIFGIVLEHVRENRELPQGVDARSFYKYLLKHLRKSGEANIFELLNEVMEIIPIKQSRIIEDYLDHFYLSDFKEFYHFLNLIENNSDLREALNEDNYNNYINSRIKNLKKEDFKGFSEEEIRFYVNFAEKNISRTILIKLGDIFSENGDLEKTLEYYEWALSLNQDHDKLYKSTLRKVSHVYGTMDSTPRSIYFIALLHSVDPSHKLAQEELKRTLKHHHLSSYYGDIMEKVKSGKETCLDYLNGIFEKRNLDFK